MTASPNPIRLTLQIEGAGIAAIACLAYAQTGGGWGLFALLILLPDVSMLGYLGGKRLGAVCYNMAHSYLAPMVLAALGFGTGLEAAWPVALIWTAHIGMDRALSYGLKYASGFKDTHLART